MALYKNYIKMGYCYTRSIYKKGNMLNLVVQHIFSPCFSTTIYIDLSATKKV